MLVSLPRSHSWTSHLAIRWGEALEIGLRRADAPSLRLDLAKVFVPDEVDQEVLATTDPQESLRSLIKEQPPTLGKWMRRRDLFGEAAEWLHQTLKTDPRARLYCEAGLSRVGDRALNQLPHIVHEGRPFLSMDIASATSAALAETLRQGRSPWRLRGIVVPVEPQVQQVFVFGTAVLFICDALDVDSLIVVSIG